MRPTPWTLSVPGMRRLNLAPFPLRPGHDVRGEAFGVIAGVS